MFKDMDTLLKGFQACGELLERDGKIVHSFHPK
jgi:hypothetical protein